MQANERTAREMQNEQFPHKANAKKKYKAEDEGKRVCMQFDKFMNIE